MGRKFELIVEADLSCLGRFLVVEAVAVGPET
jgi:hypothetical protein